MSNPFFSVIIPSYNRAHLISKTIDCVLRQTYREFELIIIDDASTDNTEAVVRGFNDSRVIYCKNEKNIERSASRNKGIKLAKGTFVCFCDSDDHWRENHLALLFEKITCEKNAVGMYFTAMTWNFADHKEDVVFPEPNATNLVEYVIRHQIGTPTTAFHFSIFQHFLFNEELKINEDVELFSRIVSAFPLFQVPVSTVDVQIHNENTIALHRDFISPQIVAFKIICSSPHTKNKISRSFKRNRFKQLRHQLINYYYESSDFCKMDIEIIRFLCLYPADPQNKSKVVMLLYHQPGGSILRSIITIIKK
jgi:glycosyltransferase involved in cell wall biosynthesis